VWVLAARVLETPTDQKITTLVIFAVFALLVDVVRRRHK
jgi:hypothetical protein